MKSASCWFGVILFAASVAQATTFIKMDEPTLVQSSDFILIGTVRSVESVATPPDGPIYTQISIEPTDLIKGDVGTTTVVLREPGGSIGDQQEWLFGVPQFWVGERCLLFLVRNNDGSLQTNSLAMGKFSITYDEDGEPIAVRDFGHGAMILVPRSGSLADAEPDSLPLEPLLERLRSLAGSDPNVGPPAALPAIADDPNALHEYHDSYTLLGSPPTRWHQADTGTTVSYPSDVDVSLGATNSATVITNALAAWTNEPSASIVLAYGGLSTATPTAGPGTPTPTPPGWSGCGGNRIVFNDPRNEITNPSGCSGTLAIGGYCSSGSTRVVNGTTFNAIVTGKVVFNNGWGTSCPALWTVCFVSEVATHEIGHSLGFGHSSENSGEANATLRDATMFYSAHNDGRCAALRADDIAAANFVYPFTGPTSTPSDTATITATPTRTPTRTPTLTATNTPSATATPTQTPTRTATSTSTPIASQTPSNTPTVTSTPVATSTPTSTPTLTASPTQTATRTPSNTPTVTSTPSSTPTLTASPTQSATHTSSNTPTLTSTPLPSSTPSSTDTATHTPSPTDSPTQTSTPTPSSTPTSTNTRIPGSKLVSGQVRYYSNAQPVDSVTVELEAESMMTTTSAVDGSFIFPEVISATSMLTPSKTGSVNNAITAIDATQVLQAVVGLRTLTAAQRLAADTNGNGTVTAIDATLILQYRVGLISTFPVGTKCGPWTFVPAAETAPNQTLIVPQPVAAPCLHGAVMYDPLAAEAYNQDFQAVLFGDVNGNWQPAAGALQAPLISGDVQLGRFTGARHGRILRVPIVAATGASFNALDVTIAYDPKQIARIRVRRAAQAAGALLAVNRGKVGSVTIALAGANPMPAGPALWLDVQPRTQHLRTNALRIVQAAAFRD
jgi:hypothetical protein